MAGQWVKPIGGYPLERDAVNAAAPLKLQAGIRRQQAGSKGGAWARAVIPLSRRRRLSAKTRTHAEQNPARNHPDVLPHFPAGFLRKTLSPKKRGAMTPFAQQCTSRRKKSVGDGSDHVRRSSCLSDFFPFPLILARTGALRSSCPVSRGIPPRKLMPRSRFPISAAGKSVTWFGRKSHPIQLQLPGALRLRLPHRLTLRRLRRWRAPRPATTMPLPNSTPCTKDASTPYVCAWWAILPRQRI